MRVFLLNKIYNINVKREDLIEDLIRKYFLAEHRYSLNKSEYFEGIMTAYKDVLSMLAFDTKLLSSESYKRIFLLRGNTI